jgi:hypothetical protein
VKLVQEIRWSSFDWGAIIRDVENVLNCYRALFKSDGIRVPLLLIHWLSRTFTSYTDIILVRLIIIRSFFLLLSSIKKRFGPRVVLRVLIEFTRERLSDDDGIVGVQQMVLRQLLARFHSISCRRRLRRERTRQVQPILVEHCGALRQRTVAEPSSSGRLCSCRSWDSSCFAGHTWAEHEVLLPRMAQKCWMKHRPKWT